MRFSHHRILSVGLLLAVAASPIARAQVNVTVDATKFVRVVDNRMFGLNTAVWDYGFQDSQTLTALQAVDAKFLRFPGGSSSDDFNWQNSTAQVEGTSSGRTTFDIFAATAKAIGAQVVITANFVTGTPDEAAAWVEYSNVTKGYGFKYWEIGNECYGTWEYYAPGAGSADPMVYATQAVKFIQKMKAVDPSIKIGVVGDASEDSYLDAPSESVINPVTGVSHSGWTPIVLATMKKSGVLPDYLIYHFYAQNPGSENDSLLLQESISWPVAATELRTQLTDYLGTAGSGVELLVTENNSCSYNPGKQMTSLVNGLYMADSVCSLMQTEFNSLVWWDLHNGQSTSNNNSSSLYGWRQYGDYGIESPAHDRYPAYYVMKLMSNFARGGDFVVTASSNNTLLSAYSVLRANGTLSILVVNKSPTVTYSTNFSINGFKPISAANVYAYGITEDTAAQTGTGSPDVAVSTISNAAASFAMSFSPYSVTLISMLSSPSAAPSATSQPASQTVASGSTAAFSFAVNGSPLPSYQWSFNGVAIPSGTASTFVVSGATPANAGSYTCTATNASGSVTSSAATLSVASSSNPGRLINISTRAVVGTGANILIPGFVIGGSGTETLLVRADGPALSGFGVSGVLAQPSLSVLDGTQNSIASNTGWGSGANPTQIASVSAQVGAFALAPSSADSALEASLPAGAYTAQISGVNNTTGVSLAEVYEVSASGTSVINISTRAQVGTGGNILIAGFVIGGSTSKTVLIRASGPALAAFGVSGTLPDPQLQLLSSSGGVLESNNGWGGNPQIAATAASVGAFSWGSLPTNDSAILVTLPPGAYTAQVSGAAGDTGVALVEVYAVQ